MNDKIKNIISQNLKGYTLEKIILFGSRARGDFDEESDYDVLVLIKEDLERTLREDICSNIRSQSAKEYIDIDILIRSSDYVQNAKNEIGNVIRYATEEGIEI